MAGWVKEPRLSLQWLQLLLWHRFDPCPGTSACCRGGQKKYVFIIIDKLTSTLTLPLGRGEIYTSWKMSGNIENYKKACATVDWTVSLLCGSSDEFAPLILTIIPWHRFSHFNYILEFSFYSWKSESQWGYLTCPEDIQQVNSSVRIYFRSCSSASAASADF